MDHERLLWAIIASELDNQEETDTFLENTNVELEEPETWGTTNEETEQVIKTFPHHQQSPGSEGFMAFTLTNIPRIISNTS